jgi:hypothetical protein
LVRKEEGGYEKTERELMWRAWMTMMKGLEVVGVKMRWVRAEVSVGGGILRANVYACG